MPAVCLVSAALLPAAASEFPAFEVYPASGGSVETVEEQESCRPWVRAAGADVNAVNDAGETPLDLAEKRGDAELIQVLRELGGE